MGTEKTRLKILNNLKKTFLNANEKGVGVDKSLLTSEICMQHGVMKSKANEYIQVLLDAKFIEQDDLGLWLAGGIKSQVLSPEEREIIENKNLEENS